MLGRHQPPAYSPLSLAALGSGMLGALSRAGGRKELLGLIDAEFHAHRVLLTSTGTIALATAIRAALAERPGLVALPAYSCYDIASAAEGAEASIVLYDLNPRTLSPDEDSLRAAVEMGATVVVVAHLFGFPVDMAVVNDVAAEGGALIIEDAAQAFGARLGDLPAGSLALLSVLSFARGKGVTGGGGGALLVRETAGDDALAELGRVRLEGTAGWSELGRAAAVWLLARPSAYAAAASLPFLHLGETVYKPPRPPAGISRSASGVLRRSWSLSRREVQARRDTADRLLRALGKSDRIAPIEPVQNAWPSYLRLPVLARGSAMNALTTQRARRLGVTLGYPRPLSELKSCKTRCVSEANGYPGAEELARSLATLPTHSLLSQQDLDALAGLVSHR